MRYLLLRLRRRLVGAYDRLSRKWQFVNADRANQTTRRLEALSSPAMIDGSTYGDRVSFVTGDCSDSSCVACLMAWEWAWIPTRQTAHPDPASPRQRGQTS